MDRRPRRVHKYMEAWYIRADHVSLARGSETARPAAPRSVSSLEEKASGLAASWFKSRLGDDRIEPVVRVEAIHGDEVELSVMAWDEAGELKGTERVTVDTERLSVRRHQE